MRQRPAAASARPYNTALKVGASLPIRATLGETRFAETARGVVFAHSMADPLPQERLQMVAERAECLYSEIPWPAGAAVFYDRAGLAQRAHADYLAGAQRLIESLKKPTFIVGSKHDVTALLPPWVAATPIVLNGEPAWLAVLHTDAAAVPTAGRTTDLLACLGATYDAAYDFSCGYGNALSNFRYRIGSDIDLKCLDYVSRKVINVPSD